MRDLTQRERRDYDRWATDNADDHRDRMLGRLDDFFDPFYVEPDTGPPECDRCGWIGRHDPRVNCPNDNTTYQENPK